MPGDDSQEDSRAAFRLAFRARLAALEITHSMKRSRELCDNVFIESFFHSMKVDAIHARTFEDECSLRRVVRRYIRRYNATRLHSSLGFRSPNAYESIAALGSPDDWSTKSGQHPSPARAAEPPAVSPSNQQSFRGPKQIGGCQ
jgi:hypothetical protein